MADKGRGRRSLPKIGKSEIAFMVAVVMLLSATFAAVVLGRPADPTLVAAALGIIGVPIFLSSDRKGGDDK